MDVQAPIIPPPDTFEINKDNVGDRFKEFRKSFEHYMKGNAYNELNDAQQIALFTSCCGEDLAHLVQEFIDKEENKSLFEILQYLEDYFCPAASVLEEQFKFQIRRQQVNEGFDKFLIELKKMAQKCEFGSHEENAIKVKLVQNIFDYHTQKMFLSRLEKHSLDEVVSELRAYYSSPRHLNRLNQKPAKNNQKKNNPNQETSTHNGQQGKGKKRPNQKKTPAPATPKEIKETSTCLEDLEACVKQLQLKENNANTKNTNEQTQKNVPSTPGNKKNPAPAPTPGYYSNNKQSTSQNYLTGNNYRQNSVSTPKTYSSTSGSYSQNHYKKQKDDCMIM